MGRRTLIGGLLAAPVLTLLAVGSTHADSHR